MAITKELPVLDSQLTLRGPQSSVSQQVKPMAPSVAAQVAAEKKPAWLKIRPPSGDNYLQIKGILDQRKLHTVCQEARCPNLSECWSTGTATFMLGGDTCTRACRFCAIKTARIPPPLDPAEPEHIAESISVLGLKYVVLTSVDRDDLPDGGATHFAQTIRAIKRRAPHVVVEALVPDFQGIVEQIEIVVSSGLDVYAHNIETVERLQYRVRDPRAGYTQSLMTLRVAKNIAAVQGRKLFTKSAIMLGLGETREELQESFEDLRGYGADVLTLGQYLRPTAQHLPVEKFYSPEEFNAIGDEARAHGFMYVASGPMVRSSYKAAEFFIHKAVIESQQIDRDSGHIKETAGEITQ